MQEPAFFLPFCQPANNPVFTCFDASKQHFVLSSNPSVSTLVVS